MIPLFVDSERIRDAEAQILSTYLVRYKSRRR